jgi:isoleucyl-tRNA synthetase
MPESVHLCDWPKSDKKKIGKDLEEKMDEVRMIVNLALAERITKAIKVKQPLTSLKIKNTKSKIKNESELMELIRDEVNVKEVIFDGAIEKEVELDVNITEELMEEGILRDIVRQIQEVRKEMKLIPQDKVSLVKITAPHKEKLIIEKNKMFLLKEFRAVEIVAEEQGALDEKGLEGIAKVKSKIYPISITK